MIMGSNSMQILGGSSLLVVVEARDETTTLRRVAGE